MSLRISCLFLFIGLAFSSPLSAAIIVNGNTSDWGVTVTDGTSANKTPSNFGTGVTVVAAAANNGFGGNAVFSRNLPSSTDKLYFQTEDQDDTAGSGGFVGPYYGGQDYDAEFLGASLSAGKTLSILVVSGQRPDNGLANYLPGDTRVSANYSPGDIRISTSVGVFGIEVGGNANNNFATTYVLNSSGHTTSVTTTNTRSAGSVWKTSSTPGSSANWIFDPIPAAPDYPVQLDHSKLTNGNLVGTASLVFTKNTVTSQHSIIEVSFDAMKFFGSNVTINSISWYPGCGNDELIVGLGGARTVPEPGSLAVVGCLSLFGLGYQRLRRKRK